MKKVLENILFQVCIIKWSGSVLCKYGTYKWLAFKVNLQTPSKTNAALFCFQITT